MTVVMQRAANASDAHIEVRNTPWPVLRCTVCGVRRHLEGPGDVDCHVTHFALFDLPARDAFALDHAACAAALSHDTRASMA